ncbi:MAG: hypothetical protein KF901_18820 [Myxococcales bacterium]|nr:hypothetical protein [Myxococcales bacterium]
MPEIDLSPKDIVRASAAVVDAPATLAALALDVLSRQGEARLLFAGEDFVDARAKEHGVSEATLAGVDVLALLRSGPTDARGFALVSALAIRGLSAHLGDAARLARFVKHADWLELTTPYAPYAFVGAVLGEDASAVWDALDRATPTEQGPRAEALRALHRAVLTEAGRAPREPTQVSESPALVGALGAPPPSGARGVLRLVSGFALLQWILRALAFAVGLRQRGELRFEGGGLKLRKTTTLLGRVVREGEETFTLAAVASIGRTTRYPAIHLLVGALALAIGVLAGGLFFVDGVRSGETYLLLFGAGLVLAGGALDLALGVLVPGTRGRVAMQLGVLPRRRLQLRGVDAEGADRFLGALERRLPAR